MFWSSQSFWIDSLISFDYSPPFLQMCYFSMKGIESITSILCRKGSRSRLTTNYSHIVSLGFFKLLFLHFLTELFNHFPQLFSQACQYCEHLVPHKQPMIEQNKQCNQTYVCFYWLRSCLSSHWSTWVLQWLDTQDGLGSPAYVYSFQTLVVKFGKSLWWKVVHSC